MGQPKFQRKFEELERSFLRVSKLYDGLVINEQGEDSFQSPKDVVLGFFRVSYELKEALKKDPQSPESFKGKEGLVEKFCNYEPVILLGLDITNQEKHIVLSRSRSNFDIGVINTHIYISLSDKKDHTELTIEIDGKKVDLLEIVRDVFEGWKKFIEKNL